MMEREWQGILSRYGQLVTISQGGEAGVAHRVFLQPVLERSGPQTIPSPLGVRREDRFLYLGPAHVSLTAAKSHVTWNGQEYEVQTAHPVGGKEVNHWWAILRPRDEVDQWA